jgi:hypothetical protein
MTHLSTPQPTCHCFQAAYRLIVNTDDEHGDLRLVHANVPHLPQAEDANLAFVEDEQFVFDCSGQGAMIPKARYYQALGIRTTRRYTQVEAITHMIRQHSFGPWG